MPTWHEEIIEFHYKLFDLEQLETIVFLITWDRISGATGIVRMREELMIYGRRHMTKCSSNILSKSNWKNNLLCDEMKQGQVVGAWIDDDERV